MPTLNSNEINLTFLILKINSLIKKHYKIMAGISIATILIVFYMDYSKIPVYKSALLLKHNFLEHAEIAKIVSTLDFYAADSDGKLIGEALQISPYAASSIKELKTEKKTVIYNQPSNAAQINILVDNEKYLPEIQDGIIRHLANSPYCSKMLDREKEIKSRLLGVLKDEEKNIDSVKNIIINTIQYSGSMFYATDLSSLLEQKRKLRESQISIEYDLKNMRAFELVQNFPSKNPVIGFGMISSLVKGLIISVMLCLAVIATSEWNNFLKHNHQAFHGTATIAKVPERMAN